MRRTELIMGMPITVVIPDREAIDRAGARFGGPAEAIEGVFEHFRGVDAQFSPYKPQSETSRLGRGEIDPALASPEMKEVLELSELTRVQSNGYFNVWHDGRFDPSGLVKGWAIRRAAQLLDADGFLSFCVEAGGDIEIRGANDEGKPWLIGLRNPFEPSKLMRSVALTGGGIATSGTYIRGDHIWDPVNGAAAAAIASLTVIGPDVYEADRFATAAFAMGPAGIEFMAALPGFDSYMVALDGTATYTPGFARYLAS